MQLKPAGPQRSVQRRFFCENCKQEVFLLSKYCDSCGGEIEWPKEVQTVITLWNASAKKQKKQK